jgi:hypothetical protein
VHALFCLAETHRDDGTAPRSSTVRTPLTLKYSNRTFTWKGPDPAQAFELRRIAGRRCRQ